MNRRTLFALPLLPARPARTRDEHWHQRLTLAVGPPDGPRSGAIVHRIDWQGRQYGKVISYRGTNFAPAGDRTADATRGWPLGGGDRSPQTALSIDFLDAVQAGNAPGSGNLPFAAACAA